MDRTLDDIISERPSERTRGKSRPEPRRPPPPRAAPRREEYPRDGIRKNRRDEPANIDSDWVHDRYEEERYERHRPGGYPAEEHERRAPKIEENGSKIKVDNIHYELTENDLRELFERIGRVTSVRLLYDRMDRSEGTAFVTYNDPRDARDAVTEFNGCNANGQPIRLSLLPTAPAAASKGTLFERVERPTRSLFDRIQDGPSSRDDSREDAGGRPRRRNRSEGPRSRPTGEFLDRYIPNGPRSRSPIKRRGTPRDPGRRPGQRREDSDRRPPRRGRDDGEGRPLVGGRPRKTAAELDDEMADYWGKPAEDGKANGATSTANGSGAATMTAQDEDIDMIE